MFESFLSFLERLRIIDSWLPICPEERQDFKKLPRFLVDRKSKLIVLVTHKMLFHIFLR